MNKITFKEEISSELHNILQFWLDNSSDEVHGGFIGKMDNEGKVFMEAEKGGVLNARILWTFSAAYNQNVANPTQNSINENYHLIQAAERAYQYINQYFRDRTFGGIYWSVDAQGNPLNTRKQIYGLAFTIYGLSEYFKANPKQEILDFAIELFELIEYYSYDKTTGGYIEAFTQDWKIIEDLRLSEKDRNDPKTMNTHLHIIEAYVNLYTVWKEEHLVAKIRYLLNVFEQKIINKENNHLILFFDNDWKKQSEAISYGHDIEASWLLQEAAEILHDEDLIKKWKRIAVKIANAASEGLNKDGSLNHEFDPNTKHLDSHREWWVSAEAMVGFYNAYQITKNDNYLKKAFNIWRFTKKHLLDYQNGEWFWGIYEDYSLMQNEDKIGFWKCPYHNARACMELLKRV
jgi:cellobiose epimerase